jgi:AcrR family transcriptional regulator
MEIAARLLAQEGPRSLSTRRIAAEAGSSTMAVYTHFGGMSELVREIVHEGFGRLAGYFARVRETEDPVADLALLGRAYRYNAQTNPHLYAIMFGGTSLSGFTLTEDDRQHGRYNLIDVVTCANRCIESGRFRPADPGLVAHQMWIAVHGIATLELGQYFIEPWTADTCFEVQLTNLMIGAGDSVEATTASIAASAARFPDEVANGLPG